MRPIVLIAANYVREQRWPALGLVLYAIGNAILFAYVGGHHVRTDDVYFYTRQQALFVGIFGLFLMSSAIYNDRRSRRILAVLSKAISRTGYLAALWVGVVSVTTIYAGVISVCDIWLCKKAGMPAGPVLFAILLAWISALAATAVTLFFSTMLHPLFASAAAISVLGAAAGWPQLSPMLRVALSPSYQLLDKTLNAPSLKTDGNALAIAFAITHAVIFFMLAAAVFRRKDIAVAIE